MPSTHTCLQVHVIFSTKNREPLLVPEIRERVWEYLGGCLRTHNAQPLGIGGVADHVHLLFGYSPASDLSTIIKEAKKPTTDWIRKEFKPLRGFAWQEGYGAYSVSKSLVPKVREYIANQEEHHRRVTFQEEYLQPQSRGSAARNPWLPAGAPTGAHRTRRAFPKQSSFVAMIRG